MLTRKRHRKVTKKVIFVFLCLVFGTDGGGTVGENSMRNRETRLRAFFRLRSSPKQKQKITKCTNSCLPFLVCACAKKNLKKRVKVQSILQVIELGTSPGLRLSRSPTLDNPGEGYQSVEGNRHKSRGLWLTTSRPGFGRQVTTTGLRQSRTP